MNNDLRVEIDERKDEPSICKVWRGDVLVFTGVSRDALLAARPARPHEALVQIRSRLREEDAVTYVPMNILADIDQIICEVGGLRDDE